MRSADRSRRKLPRLLWLSSAHCTAATFISDGTMVLKIQEAHQRSSVEVFLAFLKLGVASFGGPIAHIGYFRAEFVERRQMA